MHRFVFHSMLFGLIVLSAALSQAAPAHSVVSGFERFHAAGKGDAALGGRLLLGELNCASCHKADKATAALIANKQAPILDEVGARVRPQYLRRFLADPQAVKPGTTMPNLFATLPAAERKQTVEALVHYLASTAKPANESANRKAAARGQGLFNQVGCTACHGTVGTDAAPLATSVPLGDLERKYTLGGLADFLANPLKVRPAGRMPDLRLAGTQARDVAHYLAGGDLAAANVSYRVYLGSWSKLPDFAKMKPNATGTSDGFDISVRPRAENSGVRFEGFFRVATAGDYTFLLHSDDGSKLYIDGKLIVDNDGTHGGTTKTGKTRLAAGMRQVTVDYFNGGGPNELRVQYEGPGVKRQALGDVVSLTKVPPKPKTDKKNPDAGPFVLDADLAKQGEKLFASVGCASCHQMKGQKTPAAAKTSLAKLAGAGGCLSAAPVKGAPHFALSKQQRSAISAGVKSIAAGSAAPQAAEVIAQTLTRFNCYACHERDKLGGAEEARNALFLGSIPEMGDEGRIPPPLTGVGAKLTATWMNQLFDRGAKDRPYMHTRMPRFGVANVGHLVSAFETVDKIEPVKTPAFSEKPKAVKAAGRHLVGNKALSCTKCHNFKDLKSTGVGAMDITLMPKRLKHDWFHRYMLNPSAFRPGTRMPASFPDGQTLLKNVLGGDANKQIEAMWVYLSDGRRAKMPFGLRRSSLELVADGEAIMYRNFIQGAGTRAIGVAYPEGINLAFDANAMRLALIWQGGFIDASKHWNGRGAGFQSPLGSNVRSLAGGASFAVLEGDKSPWPTDAAKKLGYKFRGYRLDKERRPTFMYDYGAVHIEDFPMAVDSEDYPTLRRTLTLTSKKPTDNLWFQAAASGNIEAGSDGWYTIDGALKMKITAAAIPVIRNGQLLVPVKFNGGKAVIVQEFDW
ncbi:MAG: cytochrome c1 [Planctomycetes bacterium]|nr:cytochrome c1 [Planctomycetota bacterium]